MNEEEAKNWTKNKNNQQMIIDNIIAKSKPGKVKYAVFMAGIPGAGKTEFVKNSRSKIIDDSIIIEHDQLVERIQGYTPENYYSYRKAGSILVTKLFDECLKRDLSLVFDGTLSHENGQRNIAKCINSGYNVLVVYIHQDATSAWQLTQAREVVKKRSIEREGFIKTCTAINKNLLEIFNKHKDSSHFTLWIIKKNGFPGLENSTLVVYDSNEKKGSELEVESILKKDYNIN